MEMSDSMEHSSSEIDSYDSTPPLSCSGSSADSGGRYWEVFDEQCPWGSLPEELILKIFGALPTQDIRTVARVCRQWRRLGLDTQLLRKLLAGELECSRQLVDELKKKNCDSALLEDVIRTQAALEDNPWQWLASVHTSLAPALESLPPDKLASYPDPAVVFGAPLVNIALFKNLERAWTQKFQSAENSTYGPQAGIEKYSKDSSMAWISTLTTAIQSTNNNCELPVTWDAKFQGHGALNERELRILIKAMHTGVCRWNNLTVQTIGSVAFSTIKDFFRALGQQQQQLSSFHFFCDSPWSQRECNHLLKLLKNIPALEKLSFQLSPCERKDRLWKHQLVKQMHNLLSDIARGGSLRALMVRAANAVAASAVFTAMVNTRIEALTMNHGNIGITEVFELATLLANNERLAYLNLDNNGLTEKTIGVILRELKTSQNYLKRVSLKGNQEITDDDLLELVQKLRGRGLEIHLTAPSQR